MCDAAKTGRLEAGWTAELDALGMIWDKHDAAWRSRLAAAADYLRTHNHLAAPAHPRRRMACRTTPPARHKPA